jgi:hypothetical protein
MLLGTDAWASPTGAFVCTIPNGSIYTCLNCHTSMLPSADAGDYPQLTQFGDDVQVTMNGISVDAGGIPNWTAALCQKDSDGDGLTNGQELGDPCCTWVEAAGCPPEIAPAPRTTAISNPSEPTSVSTDPNTPACGTPPPPGGDDGGGGCTVVGSAVGLSGAAVALVVMALAGGPLRRRRR